MHCHALRAALRVHPHGALSCTAGMPGLGAHRRGRPVRMVLQARGTLGATRKGCSSACARALLALRSADAPAIYIPCLFFLVESGIKCTLSGMAAHNHAGVHQPPSPHP